MLKSSRSRSKPFSFRKRKSLRKKKSIKNNIINKGMRVQGENRRFSSRKGQWFIISAVIVSGTFLAISILFNEYFIIDTSDTALIDEDYYYNNVRDGMEKTVALSNCTNVDRNIKNYIESSEQGLSEIGYFLYMEYTINGCIDPNTVDYTYGILLASNRYARCTGTIDNADAQAQLGINFSCP